MNDEQCMQFVNKDGVSYLVSADRDLKINGICHWEQAFKIYAAIYSKVNPHHSSKIWQYVHIINTAAGAYVWENVAYYDFTFWQLMSERPECSWSQTYNQLWNLAMYEPLTKQTKSNQGASYSGTSQGGTSTRQAR